MTLYGAKLASSPANGVNFDGGQVIGKNSEVFAEDDLLTTDTGGLEVASATDAIYGIAQKAETMTSSNQTVAKVKPNVLVPDLDYEFIMGCNADLTPLTSVGAFYKITGTTGAMQVDVTSGVQTTTNRVVECTSVDPFNLGGTGAGSGLRIGKFRIVKRYNLMNY
jgi:hypothetical protein